MTRFDAHCHLTHAAFELDVQAVLARARDAGVTRIHAPGFDPASFSRGRGLEGVVRGVGLHPWWISSVPDDAMLAGLAAMRAAIAEGDVVSIGEVGLDRGSKHGNSIARQTRALELQLALARETSLPVVLHCVDAHGRMIELLERHGPFEGVVHGFSGEPEMALRYVALGLHVSFGPLVTVPTARRARAAAVVVPDDRLLVESDAPDQRPYGATATRSEPAVLGTVIDALAVLRGTTSAHVGDVTYANAARLFVPQASRRAGGAEGC
jgi:TatD DNase family protein